MADGMWIRGTPLRVTHRFRSKNAALKPPPPSS